MKFLLVSNGTLAQEMRAAMQRFCAKPEIDTIGLTEGQTAVFVKDVQDYLANAADEVLILCDYWGSAAFNEVVYYVNKFNLADRTGIIWGMNLPMVFKLYGLKDSWDIQNIRKLYLEGDSQGTIGVY